MEGRHLVLPVLKEEEVVGHQFVAARKVLKEGKEMKEWTSSKGATTLFDFVMALNLSVSGKSRADYPLADLVSSSSSSAKVVLASIKVLEEMRGWVKEIPPLQQPQRFGNKAFKVYYERLQANAPRLMQDILADTVASKNPGAVAEIAPYLVESVGNSTRIDYGTGHELSFLAWMCCLHLVGAVHQDHFPHLVLHVFAAYLDTMRTLQRTYVMEPAGSHGVWGLDDFQFLPFLWGSSQFIDHPNVKPKSLTSADMVESLAPNYLFMAGIQFIREMKKGPFAEHSPMLYDISAVPLWQKVNTGLHKMYAVEVMGKFPVIQHFLFGSLLTLEPSADVNPFLQGLQEKK